MTKYKYVDNFNTEGKNVGFFFFSKLLHRSCQLITIKSGHCFWSNGLESSRYYKNLKQIIFLAEGRRLRVCWLIRADELTNHLQECLSDIINKIVFHSISSVKFAIP